MLIHLTPELYTNKKNVELTSVSITQLNLNLYGGKELRVWHSKHDNMKIACQKNTRGKIEGFLINSKEWLRNFEVIIRWKIEENQILHHIRYNVKNDEKDGFTLVSSNPYLWFGTSKSLGGWSSRMPLHPKKVPVSMLCSVMEYEESIPDYGKSNTIDHRDFEGNVYWREQSVWIPSIEPDRLLKNKIGINAPSIKKAFQV